MTAIVEQFIVWLFGVPLIVLALVAFSVVLLIFQVAAENTYRKMERDGHFFD